MRNFWLKNFRTSKCVRVFYWDEDGRVHESYEMPKAGEIVSLKGRFLSFMEDRGAVTYTTRLNIPTYFTTYKNAEPVNFDIFPASNISMAKFDLAINNRMAEEVFRSTNKSLFGDVNLFTLVFIIFSVFLLGLYMDNKINKLETTLQPDPTPIVEVEPNGWE